ncbi:MAG: SpoIIE family protein phosphatase [Acidobacteria bacterium]|nr:SpoIIE family protein phosphatase [Acidobacteriota bacterium]
MSNPETAQWPRSVPRLDSEIPYLRILFVTLYVRDVDRGIRFYVEQLGFNLIFDTPVGGSRFVVVGPPDGSAMLCLAAAHADSDEDRSIGRTGPVVFLTENVWVRYEQWHARGVQFQEAPHEPSWGGLYASLEDLDGNSLKLVESDDLSRELDRERRRIAEKIERDRRTARELDFAKQVQARLFPQSLPQLNSLDYAGLCMQAREVGGDYYDFLNLGRQRLGLVLGDISGKGMAAALLMANLQANLRSQYATAREQPRQFLESVNRLFYQNTVETAYATLFFGDYDDQMHRLRYANCGHYCGLLLRANGQLDRLDSTGTVLGLFDEWKCDFAERQLHPGDTLVLYTDGVTESFDACGQEFGEDRLVDALRRHLSLPSEELLARVMDEVRAFSPHEQHDDITLIAAKCTSASS